MKNLLNNMNNLVEGLNAEELKKQALLEELELNADTEIEVNGNYFEVENMTYLVVNKEERQEEFYNYQMGLIDDLGIESFSEWAREYIINNFVDVDYFKEIQRECNESYIEELKEEPAFDEKYNNRLEEELADLNLENEEEYLNLLCENEDVEWYLNNFGKDSFNRLIIENDLINWNDVIVWISEVDGYNCLASYDGEEIELNNNLYAYRID